jgi:serine/threonine-protein kinase
VQTPATVLPACFGPYAVIGLIGRGSHTRIYKVRHRRTGAIAVVKVGPHFLWLDPGAMERFRQEFKAVAPLSHPSVVRALALGQQDGNPYLVLEYVPGQNLEDRLKQQRILPVDQALAIFRQIADGVRYLHTNGIVHRDIKPSNVLITTYDQAKLADFGLLKNLKGSQRLTQSRKGMGTLGYGAPEQFENAKHVDHRCDLFSLAATLYTALTGTAAFGSGPTMQVMRRKLLGQYTPLRQLLPALDPALDAVASMRSLATGPQAATS